MKMTRQRRTLHKRLALRKARAALSSGAPSLSVIAVIHVRLTYVF
jgi:hypothetical protein